MNLALIGYGKMGHAIEALAPSRGHQVVCTIDSPDEWLSKTSALSQADVAIEFSTPATAVGNIRRCFSLGLPVVCGTTGWYATLPAISDECRRQRQALFVASNFSIGMNIMFYLNRRLVELMASRDGYTASITETHHVHKLDAPSGTALSLQHDIQHFLPSQEVPITSIREGEVPGTHVVSYDSPDDTIQLTHCAHSRRGLAIGALLAAEFLSDGKRGVFDMQHLLAL